MTYSQVKPGSAVRWRRAAVAVSANLVAGRRSPVAVGEPAVPAACLTTACSLMSGRPVEADDRELLADAVSTTPHPVAHRTQLRFVGIGVAEVRARAGTGSGSNRILDVPCLGPDLQGKTYAVRPRTVARRACMNIPLCHRPLSAPTNDEESPL